MTGREYMKAQADTLPEQILEKVLEFISFQKFRSGLFEDDTDYLMSIPGMLEKIEAASNESISEGVPVSELWPDV